MPLRAGGAARHRDPGLNGLPRTFVRVHESVREHSTDRPACYECNCDYHYDYNSLGNGGRMTRIKTDPFRGHSDVIVRRQLFFSFFPGDKVDPS